MILGQPLFFSVQGFNFGKANIKTWRPGSPHFPRTEACSKIRVQLSSQPEQIDKLERRRQYLEVEVKALSKEKVPQGGGAMMAMFFFCWWRCQMLLFHVLLLFLLYLIIITNTAARPWGLPGLATSVRASQDDDDDDGEDDDDDDDDNDDEDDDDNDDDDFDIFLKHCKRH